MLRPSNLRRYVHNHWSGWVVAVKRRGRKYVRYFSDRKHGGATGARRAATAHRDALVRSLPPLSKIKARHVRNRTGVIGVQRTRQRSRSGRLLTYYRAGWYSGGRRHGRSFSVLKYGASEAKRRAVKVRREAVREILRRPRGGGGVRLSQDAGPRTSP